MTLQNLLFTSNDGTLYATNGGTVDVIASGTSTPLFSADSVYGNMSATVLGNDAYLILADSTGSTSAIWQYDGTVAAQITPATDYIFNGQDTNTTVNPGPIGTYNGDLVFGEATLASNSNGDNTFDTTTLAIYDPTTQQTTQPATPNGGYDPHDFVTLNGTLYFEAIDNSTTQQAIYSYDGTSVTEIYNHYATYLNTVYNASFAAAGDVQGSLIAFNGSLYFGSGQESVYELTSTASLSNSATDVAGSAQYNDGITPATDLIVAGNHLFFGNGNNGIYSLSTTNGLTQVLGSLGAQSFVPVVYNGTLYFTAYDPNSFTPNLYTSTGGGVSVAVSGANFSGFVQMGTLLYDNNGTTNLGTFDGNSVGTLTVPGTANTTPLIAVPFDAVSWSSSAPASPPSVTAGATASFTGGGPAVTLDGALTVTDASSATLAGATVSIGTGFIAGDVLNFVDQNGVTGSYSSATGVLTLSGTASVSNYQAALESITYAFSPANGDPTAGGSHTSRTIDWTVTDGVGTSSVAASTLQVGVAPPGISGAVGGQATTDEASLQPFASIAITDANSGVSETVTVSLSSAANGTLTNLGGGAFNNGTYTVTGSSGAVSLALQNLSFVPTAHEVAPGDTVTTTFDISVINAYGGSAGDTTTSVVATAVNDSPAFSGIAANPGVPGQQTSTPFSGTGVVDPDIGHVETVTVMLSDTAGGALSDSAGGNVDPTTGAFTVTGSLAAVNAALQALVFTPSATPQGFVQTTTLTAEIINAGGSATSQPFTVTSVDQILGLAAAPLSQDLVDVSPDGSGLPAPTLGSNNEVVVSQVGQGQTYTLPSGFQAEFLTGSSGAALTDPSVGNALLVGNDGADSLSAGAGSDTLWGGVGSSSFGVTGTQDVVLAHGASSVFLGGDEERLDAGGSTNAVTISGAGDSVLGGSGGTITAEVNGDGALLSAGGAELVATITGSGAVVYGGAGGQQAPGSLNIDNTGSATTIDVFASSATIASSGANAAIVAGSAATAMTVSGSGTSVFGGAGDLSLIATGASAPTIVGSGPNGQITAGAGGLELAAQPGDAATISGGAGPTTVFGSQGANVTFQGSTGGALFVAGSGTETLNAGQSSTANQFSGGSSANDAALMIGGSGNDTLIGGAGNDTMTGGGGSDLFAFFSSATAGQHDVITDFSASDAVYVLGYAANQTASTLDTNATVDGSGVTIMLSDSTQITFSNLTSATQLYGHILYAPVT